MSTTPRGEQTRQAILEAGLTLAAGGLHLVTGRGVARAVGITHANVRYYYTSPAALLDAVAGLAVKRGDMAVMRRLLVEGHAAVDTLPERAKRRCLNG